MAKPVRNVQQRTDDMSPSPGQLGSATPTILQTKQLGLQTRSQQYRKKRNDPNHRSLGTAYTSPMRSMRRSSEGAPLRKRAGSLRFDASSSESRYQPTDGYGAPLPVQNVQRRPDHRPPHIYTPTSRSNSPFSTWLRTTVDLSTRHGRAPAGRSRTPGPPSSRFDTTVTSLYGFPSTVEDPHQPRLQRAKSAPIHQFLDDSIHRGSFSDRRYRPDPAEPGKFLKASVSNPALGGTENLARLGKNDDQFREPESQSLSSQETLSLVKAPNFIQAKSKTSSDSLGSRKSCVTCFGGIFKKSRKPRATRRDVGAQNATESAQQVKKPTADDRSNASLNLKHLHSVPSGVAGPDSQELQHRSGNPLPNTATSGQMETSSDEGGRPKCLNCFGPSRAYRRRKQSRKNQNRKGGQIRKGSQKDDFANVRLWTNPLHGLKLPPNPFSRQASRMPLYSMESHQSGDSWSTRTNPDLQNNPQIPVSKDTLQATDGRRNAGSWSRGHDTQLGDSPPLPKFAGPDYDGTPHQGGNGQTPWANKEIEDSQRLPTTYPPQAHTQASEQSLDSKSNGQSSRWRIPARFQSPQSVIHSSQDVTTGSSKTTGSNQSSNHVSQKNHRMLQRNLRRSLSRHGQQSWERRTIERRYPQPKNFGGGCFGALCRSRKKQNNKNSLKPQAGAQSQPPQTTGQTQKSLAETQVQKSQAGDQPANFFHHSGYTQKTSDLSLLLKTPQRNVLAEPMYDMMSHYQSSLIPSLNSNTASPHNQQSPKRSPSSDIRRIDTPNDSGRWLAHYRQYFLDESLGKKQKVHTAPDHNSPHTPNASGSKSPQSAQSAPQLTVVRQKNLFTSDNNRLGSLTDSQSEVDFGGLQRISASQSSRSESKDRQEHHSQHNNQRRSAYPSKESTMKYNHENTLSDVSSHPSMSGSTENSAIFDDRLSDLIRHIDSPKSSTSQNQKTYVREATKGSSSPDRPHQEEASTSEMPDEEVKNLIHDFAKLGGSPKSQKIQSPRPNIPLYGETTSPRMSGDSQRKMVLSRPEGTSVKSGLIGQDSLKSPRSKTSGDVGGLRRLGSDVEDKVLELKNQEESPIKPELIAQSLDSPRSKSSGGSWSPKSLGLNINKKIPSLDKVEESPVKPEIISQQGTSPRPIKSPLHSELHSQDETKPDLKGTLLNFKKLGDSPEKTDSGSHLSETPRYTRLRKASEIAKSRNRNAGGRKTQSQGDLARPQKFHTWSEAAPRPQSKPRRRDKLPLPDPNIPETSKQAADNGLKGLKGLLRERYQIRTKTLEQSSPSPFSSPRQAFKSLQGSSGESAPDFGFKLSPSSAEKLETPSIVPKSASSSPKSWGLNTGKVNSHEVPHGQARITSSSPKSSALNTGKINSHETTMMLLSQHKTTSSSPKYSALNFANLRSHGLTQPQSKTASSSPRKSTLSKQEQQLVDAVRRIRHSVQKQPSKPSRKKGQ